MDPILDTEMVYYIGSAITPASRDGATASAMEPAMYNAAKLGHVDYLKSRSESDPSLNLTTLLTPQKNTVLHIASRFRQMGFVSKILEMHPDLLLQTNSKGDSALHVAARSGDLGLVELLIKHYHEMLKQNNLELGQQAPVSLWRKCNLEGNTVLHEAIANKNSQVGLRLLAEDPGLAVCVNNAMESPLYLASHAGMLGVAKKILTPGRNFSVRGPDGQTALHAAALRGQTENANLLCSTVPHIIGKTDDFGRTALHYSVSISASKISAMLLKADLSLAYIRDKDGLTPLLIAVVSSHWSMIKLLLKYCPDCGELPDSNGQNALHLVMRKSLRCLKLINHPDLKELLNEDDNDGNTPLHVAIKTEYGKGIRRLLRRKGVNLRARNKEGLTVLDLSEKSWHAITLQRYLNVKKLVRRGAVCGGKTLGRKPQPAQPLDELKQLANTLLVVTTLICTIAVTAAFTLPGGYSSDPSDIGLASLGKRAAFQAFLFCDAIAVCSSTTCAFFLVRGLIGNGYLRSALFYSIQLLAISLSATMVAFSTGIYSVLADKCRWLAILIVVAGCSVPLWLKMYTDDFLTKEPISCSYEEIPKNIIG